ncbi:hypothetical protein SUDANB120_01687 [Streptomyces sp. enrichment culture]
MEPFAACPPQVLPEGFRGAPPGPAAGDAVGRQHSRYGRCHRVRSVPDTALTAQEAARP